MRSFHGTDEDEFDEDDDDDGDIGFVLSGFWPFEAICELITDLGEKLGRITVVHGGDMICRKQQIGCYSIWASCMYFLKPIGLTSGQLGWAGLMKF